MVCYVAAHTHHVSLGFRHGALVDDPDGLLEGTGKQMRHAKLRDPATVPRKALAVLLEQAALEPPGRGIGYGPLGVPIPQAARSPA